MIGNILLVSAIVLLIATFIFNLLSNDMWCEKSFAFALAAVISGVVLILILIGMLICSFCLESKDNGEVTKTATTETHQLVQVKLKTEKEARGNGSRWILFGTDTMSSSEERVKQSYYRFYVKMSGGIKQMKVSADDTLIKYVKPGEKPHYDEIKTTKITRVKKALHSQFGWLADAINHDFANGDKTETQQVLYVPENSVKLEYSFD